MKSFAFKSTGAVCALALAIGTASAQEVTLKSPNGTVDLQGQLVGFNDQFYIIKTNLGELRVSTDRVECTGAACPRQTEEPAPVVLASVEQTEDAIAEIAIAGSETIGVGLMRLLLEGYAATTDAEALPSEQTGPRTTTTMLVSDGGFGDPFEQYVVTSRGSQNAFNALQDGSAQIGMASRRILPTEARALRADGAGNMVSIDQEHIIGVDSLVVVAHPDNPVDSLTLDQLGKIYSGVIKNWSEVGGPDADILVIDRPEKSGTRDVLAKVFEAAVISNVSPLEVRIANDSNKAAELVRENEHAIGFLGYAFQRGTKALALVNECNAPMVADTFSARTEEYPLRNTPTDG